MWRACRTCSCSRRPARTASWRACCSRARAAGINPGYRLRDSYPEYEDGLLVAITERRTKAHIDRLAAVADRQGVPA